MLDKIFQFFKTGYEAFKAAKTLDQINMVFMAVTTAVGVKGFLQARQMMSKGQDIMANKTAAGGKIPVIYGTRRVGAQIVYMDTAQNRSRDLFVVYAISVGECEEILGKTIEIDGNSILDGNIYKGGGYVGSDKISSGNGSLNTASQVGDNQYSNAGTLGTDPTLRYSFVFNLHHGASSQTADPMLRASIPTEWTTNHKLNGICYIAGSFDYDKKGMYKGVPQITVQVKGKKVYDPRTDTTAWSSNPALCFLDYIQNDEYGKGLATSQINMTTISAAATACEVEVDQPYYNDTYQDLTWSGTAGNDFIVINDNDDWWQNKVDEVIDIRDSNDASIFSNAVSITGSTRYQYYDSVQENRLYIDDVLANSYTNEAGNARAKVKRFHCNGYIDTNKNVMDNAKELLANMRGIFLYIDGKYELQIEDTGTSTFSITDDHIIADAGISVDYGNKDKKANKVVIEFFNANKKYELDTATVLHDASPEYYSDDGEVLEVKAEFPYVTDPYIAYNMGKAILTRSRNQTTMQFLGTPEMYKLNVGDIVSLTYLPLSFSGKVCRVEALELQTNGLVSVSLIEYFDVYTWEVPAQEPVEIIAHPPSIGAIHPPEASSIVFTDTDASSINRPTLTWTEPTDFPVRQYRVDVVDSSGNNVFSKIVDTPSVDLAFLPKAANYEASITSFNGVGIESNPSTKTFTIADDPVKTTEVEMNGVTLSTVESYGTVTGQSGNWVKFTNQVAFIDNVDFEDPVVFNDSVQFENAPTFADGLSGQGLFNISAGSIQFGSYTPSTTTNNLYNVGGSLYWNGQALGTGTGDITAVVAGTNLNGGGTSGSVTLNLDSTITGNHTFSNNLIIGGDLTVQGTTTTVNTDDLNVKDKNITLNYSTGDSSASANGAGITIQDAVSATQDATLTWNTSSDRFNFSHGLDFPDSALLAFGDGDDLRILHNGTNSVFSNYTGNLDFKNFADDADIRFWSDDGSGGSAIYFRLDGSQATASQLITRWDDNSRIALGSTNDLQLYHDGSHSYIYDGGVGDLKLQATNLLLEATDGTNYIHCADDGAVRLYYNGFTKLATTNTGIDVTGTVTSDGLTVDKENLSGLKTWSNSDVGSIDFYQAASYPSANQYGRVFDINSGSSNSVGGSTIRLLTAEGNGAGLQRLTVNNYGDISFYDDTGTTQGLFWDASAESLGIGTTSPSEKLTVVGETTSGSGTYGTKLTYSNGNQSGIIDTFGNHNLEFRANNDRAMNIATNGDISFYEDTGTTAKLFWDASAEQLLLGITATAAGGSLVAKTDSNGYGIAIEENSGSERWSLGVDVDGDLNFINSADTTPTVTFNDAGSVGIGTDSPTSYSDTTLHVSGSTSSTLKLSSDAQGNTNTDGFDITFSGVTAFLNNRENGEMQFRTNNSERARIDSSGNLLVGKTSSSTGVAGARFSANGFSNITRDGGECFNLNRLTSDGTIIDFRKDSATVGSIGTLGNYITIGDDDTAIRFHAGVDAILPHNSSTNANRDNAISLGTSTERFKDLHLSGTANFGSLSDGTITITGFVDQDDMSSDSATLLPTQQSVKAYVDANSFTINNNADNRIITGTATAGTLNAETTLTYGTTGADLAITGGSIGGVPPILRLEDVGSSGKLTELNHISGTTTLISRNATSNGVIKFAGHNGTSETEYGRITATGELLLNKTSASVGTDGVQLRPSSYSGFSATSATALFVNRNTNDGDVVEIGKNGVKVGSIGTRATYLTMGTGDVGLMFNSGSNRIQPENVTTGAITSGLVDLGYSGGRFKDLHLSNNIKAHGDSSPTLDLKDTTNNCNLLAYAQNSTANIGTYSNHPLIFDTNSSERMRIDSSGRLNMMSSAGASPVLYHGNDLTSTSPTTNLSFGNEQNGALLIYTNSTERLRIDSSGRVGIGTSSPAGNLQVYTSANRFQSLTGAAADLEIVSDNNTNPVALIKGTGGADLLNVFDNTTEVFTILDGGNVGIGTSSPSAVLTVDGTTKTFGDSGITLKRTGSVTGEADIILAGVSGSEALSFRVNDSEKFRVQNNGYFGIGTDSPSRKLEVNAGSASMVAQFKSTLTSSFVCFANSSSTADQVRIGSNGTALTLSTNYTERARIDSSGNFLVSTTNAAVDTGVASGVVLAASDQLLVGTSAAHSAAFNRIGGASGDIIQLKHNGSTVGSIGSRASAVSYMVLDPRSASNGGVGIGTTAQAIVSTDYAGANVNGTKDLGNASYKWKDLHLSGTGYFGTSVGIGTASPASTLDLNGNLTLSGAANDINFTGGGTNKVTSTTHLVLDFDSDNDQAGMSFRITHNGGTELFRINNAGNVGIGTSSPSKKLEVNGYGKFTNSDNSPRLHLTGGRDYFLTSTSSGVFGLYDNTASAYRLTVDSSGDAEFSGNVEMASFLSLGNASVQGTFTSEGLFTTDNKAQIEGIKSSATDAVATIKNRSSTNEGRYLQFLSSIGTNIGQIGHLDQTESNLFISTFGTGLKFESYITYKAVLPCNENGADSDNAIDLGSSSVRFDDVYATNGTIQTSDRNEKQDIQALTDAEQRVATACKGLIRRFRWQDSVAEKDDNPDSDETARYHFGVIAQDLQDAFTAEGLDAGDYGMFISSTWTDDDGVEQTRLGVRYNELLSFIITTI